MKVDKNSVVSVRSMWRVSTSNFKSKPSYWVLVCSCDFQLERQAGGGRSQPSLLPQRTADSTTNFHVTAGALNVAAASQD